MKAGFLFLAHALMIAMARVNGDPKYKSYRDGYSLKHPFQDLLSASSVDLTNGGEFKELEQFQNYLSDYKIVVYDGLSPDRVLSVEIPFRTRNCTLYMILDTTIVLRISKQQWPRSTYVTRVTQCMTIHTSVTEFAPYGQRHHPVPKMSQSIVLHATGGS